MPQAKLSRKLGKAPYTDRSKMATCAALRAAQQRFSATKMENTKAETHSDSRSSVDLFLSALGPVVAEVPSLSKDLDRISRVVKSVLQSVDDGILSDEEANAVINFIGGCFARRRMDEVVSKMTSLKSGSWFLVQHHAMD